ncbi:MAG: diguanylate cyclase [Giesbergeria sp.]|jgi:diguanylate cyclase (GGDEF)-like protein|nr:diguanylate cyclase [Giesbergeria sp.]
MPLSRTFTLRSLRGQLTLWFGGLSLLTLLCVGLYVGRLATQQMAASAGASVHAMALTAADLLGAGLRERELDIVLLSQAPHFTRGDLTHPDLLLSLQRRRAVRQEFAWMGVVDPQGKVIQAVDGLLQGQSVAERPWFIAARSGVYAGDVHEALLLEKMLPKPPDGEPLRFIDFAAPMRSPSGELLGVVGAHVDWRWVTQTVQSAFDQRTQDNGAEILITNAAGVVLYPQKLSHQFQLPAELRSMGPGRRYTRVQWDDGQDYLSSMATVDARTSRHLGWNIVVRQPLEQALQPAHAMRDRLLALGLLAALVFGAVALRLARLLSRPIEQLATAARRIERGDNQADFPEEGQLLEVEQLGRSLRSMTQALRAHEHALEAINQSLEAQVLQRTEALEAANRELEHLATHDPLTGVHNRRRFDDKLRECFETSRRTGQGFAVLLLDIDHFKKINDTHGHPAGDAVLQTLAHLLADNIRTVDFVARYGGEEFVILLPHTPDTERAMTAAEKIRASIAQATFPGPGQVTASIGISVWQPADPQAVTVVERADAALYQAKAAGRNRAVPG